MSDSNQAPPPGGGDPLQLAQDQATSNFQATSAAMKRLDSVKRELDVLAKLGDSVTPEDVIKGAGELVANGSDPMMLASLMADMPTNGGEALAAWVAQHSQQVAVKEQQLQAAHVQTRHQMGVAAIHSLIGHGIQQARQAKAPAPGGTLALPSGGASPPPPEANELTMGGPTNAP